MKTNALFAISCALGLSAVLAASGCGSGDSSTTNPMPVSWSYSGSTGPQYWGQLDPSYSLCGTGQQQSPIDLSNALLEAAGQNITLKYSLPGSQLLNSGHTLLVNFPAGNTLHLGSTDYNLKHFHLHTPAEHTVSGVQAAMEVHLLHQSDSGGIAMVTVLLELGAANPWLARMLASVPAKGQTVTVGQAISANELLPTNMGHYAYTGSLTTPPCTEGVEWLIMAETDTVSAGQVAQFAAINGPNFRPIQGLDGRELDDYPSL